MTTDNKYHSGRELAVEILHAMGIPTDNVRGITLRCGTRGPAVLTVECLVPRDDPRYQAAMAATPKGEWPAVFERYELVRRDEAVTTDEGGE